MPTRKTTPSDDHDSPWKDALEIFFRQAIELLAPNLYAVIDWSVAPQFLDKELQAISMTGDSHGNGRLHADKLVQVRHQEGIAAWILVHVEVQGGGSGPRAIARITHRMYRYRTHIEDRHERLSAQDGQAPPAQLRALQYRDRSQRMEPTVSLVRMLYEYGYHRSQIQPLLRLIEWMLRLPAALEPAYLAAIEHLEQERKMSYVMIAERRGIAKGLQQGLEQGMADLLLRLIQRRFGPVDTETTQRIRAARVPELETWSLNTLDAATLDEVFGD